MNQRMEKHVRYVSTAFVALGTLYLLAVPILASIGYLLMKKNIQSMDVEISITSVVITGAALLLPMGMLGILHIVAGRAFRVQKDWARVFLWILAIVNLGNVPIGTVIGAYGVWVLINTREDVRDIGR